MNRHGITGKPQKISGILFVSGALLKKWRWNTAKIKVLILEVYIKNLNVWAAGAALSKLKMRILRRDYPTLWQEMQRLDAKAPNTFKIGRSIAQYERSFAQEDKQIKLFGNYKAHKVPLCDLNIDEVKQQYIEYTMQKSKKSEMKKLQGGLF